MRVKIVTKYRDIHEGELVKEDDRYVVIKTDKATVTVRKSWILSRTDYDSEVKK